MRVNFILRLYKYDRSCTLGDISEITISDITLVSKPQKFGGVCMHKGNQRKFKYTVEFSRPFSKVAGSHSSPMLWFPGDYIDVIVRNFPRYPAYYQDKYIAKNIMNGYKADSLFTGFPYALQYRKVEILKLDK